MRCTVGNIENMFFTYILAILHCIDSCVEYKTDIKHPWLVICRQHKSRLWKYKLMLYNLVNANEIVAINLNRTTRLLYLPRNIYVLTIFQSRLWGCWGE